MANFAQTRFRSNLYLVAGSLLLIAELYVLFGRSTEWQAGVYTPRFLLSLAGLVLAGYFLRQGWKMRRRKDNLLD